MASQPTKDADKGRILPFRPSTPHSWNARLRLRDQSRSPISDLSKFSRGREEDNYPHRMFMNLLAFLVLSFVIGCGIWLANNMSEWNKDQDCRLISRTYCVRYRDLPRHDEVAPGPNVISYAPVWKTRLSAYGGLRSRGDDTGRTSNSDTRARVRPWRDRPQLRLNLPTRFGPMNTEAVARFGMMGCVLLVTSTSPAAEVFKKLSGSQIRSATNTVGYAMSCVHR
jgi:hypothetical protein